VRDRHGNPTTFVRVRRKRLVRQSLFKRRD
jgi:hypothetical protein